MKGLILTGGTGSRLRPITHTGAKQLIPIANKPLLYYVIEDLRNAGIRDIGFIVGDTAPEIMGAVGDGSQWGITPIFISQVAPLGLAHAVLTARDYIKDDPFVVYLGDNFLVGGLADRLSKMSKIRDRHHIFLTQVPNPEDFGVAVLGDGMIYKLVEKPQNWISDYAVIGVYVFTKGIFPIVEEICAGEPSFRGEYEIMDAVQRILESEVELGWSILVGWWKDTGSKVDLLAANRMQLDTMKYDIKNGQKIEGNVADCVLEGRVVVETGAEIEKSSIRGPVVIGKNVRMKRAYIGPYTSVGDGVTIVNSEVENSIVLSGACLSNVPGRISDSLIGRDVEISRGEGKPTVSVFMVGDNSSVVLP